MASHIRFATANMFKDLDADASRKLVDRVLGYTDVVVWQEVTRVHKATLKATDGWDHFFPRGLGIAISWRRSMFTVQRAGRWRRVVPGIKHVDPNRGFADVVLHQRGTATLWPVLGTHMTHQAWTSHPERRPRWRALAARLRLRSRRLARRYGRVLGGGDVNRSHWAPGATIGAWPARPTHGSQRYDVLWRRGRVALVGTPVAIATPSDHDAVVAAFQAT